MEKKYERGGMEFKDTPERRVNFRITIFGTGSEKTVNDKAAIKTASNIAPKIVEQGFSLATGGYGGVMKAASESGAVKAKELGFNPNERILAFPLKEDENLKGQEVTEADIVRSETLPKRLVHLIDESSGGYIIIGGGYGTTVEMLTVLETRRINAKLNPEITARPIVIIDESLKHTDLLTRLARKEKKLQGSETLDQTYILGNEPQAVDVASQIMEAYYQKSIGLEIPDELNDELSRYNLGKFLKNQEEFNEGGGI
jgi:predicted Rossmann-fold nucleotide-binding protein